MKKSRKLKLRLENLSVASGAPRQHLLHLVDALIREVEQNYLEAGTVVSVGDYGHIRLEVDQDDKAEDILLVRDVEAGSKSADGFVTRLMAFKSFEHIDNGAWPEALECLDYALELKPNDAVLLQARASVRSELVRAVKTNSEAVHLVMGAFDDLLRSIELAPGRAEAYNDLLSMLKGLRPIDVDQAEHRLWLSRVVGQALSHPTHDPEATAAREALREFEHSAG
jgi:tetratricopeptide (TPR) repeat protein